MVALQEIPNRRADQVDLIGVQHGGLDEGQFLVEGFARREHDDREIEAFLHMCHAPLRIVQVRVNSRIVGVGEWPGLSSASRNEHPLYAPERSVPA